MSNLHFKNLQNILFESGYVQCRIVIHAILTQYASFPFKKLLQKINQTNYAGFPKILNKNSRHTETF